MGASASISTDAPYDIILFDGVCNLCSGAVRFVIRKDHKQRFKFSSLQSPFAQALVKQNKRKPSNQSVILIRGSQLYDRSDAVLEIVRHLSGVWPILFAFKIIPKFVRDALYDLIARNRYKIFGRKETCMVPTPELKHRFMGEVALE